MCVSLILFFSQLTASLERDKKKAVVSAICLSVLLVFVHAAVPVRPLSSQDDEKAKSANEILRLTRSNTANEEHISLLKVCMFTLREWADVVFLFLILRVSHRMSVMG